MQRMPALTRRPVKVGNDMDHAMQVRHAGDACETSNGGVASSADSADREGKLKSPMEIVLRKFSLNGT